MGLKHHDKGEKGHYNRMEQAGNDFCNGTAFGHIGKLVKVPFSVLQQGL